VLNVKKNVKILLRHDTQRIAISNMNYFCLKKETRRDVEIGYHSLGKKCWVRLGYNMVVYFSLGLCLLA
jgi:hypothetical protein